MMLVWLQRESASVCESPHLPSAPRMPPASCFTCTDRCLEKNRKVVDCRIPQQHGEGLVPDPSVQVQPHLLFALRRKA